MNSTTAIWSAQASPRLLASRADAGDALRFPPFGDASPLATGRHTVELPSEGVVYSFTVIHPNPKLGAQPFALGYVNMEGPARIFGRIRGEGLTVGARCVAVPDPEFGYAFDLIQE